MARHNRVYKTPYGVIQDEANDLHVHDFERAFFWVGTRYEPGRYVVERANRTRPVPVTSTDWNAMQRACKFYNDLP